MQTLEILFPQKKLKILEWILSHPTSKIKIREISKEIGVNPGYVSTLVAKLKKLDIIRGDYVNMKNPETRALKIQFNISKIHRIVKKIKERKIAGVGLYGSFSKGTNVEDSDIDLWIKTKEDFSIEKQSKIRATLREKTGVGEISLMILTEKRLAEIRKKDSTLYSILLNSFLIKGEHID
jgi:predicted nucleotidyltransferase